MVVLAGSVIANPVDGTVTAGQATISNTGATTTITQQSNRALIDWRGFDIAPGEHTQFLQPNSNAIAVNRVTSGGASQIDGRLTANGNVVIINQNGVMFGRGAQVDVNGLVAATSDIDADQFMAGGPLQFNQPGNPNASVVNEGTITAKDAGLVGLVAPHVSNSGVIQAKMGRVHLASGDRATVDFYGDGLLEVAVSDAVASQLVSNTGSINADGGTVALTAASGRNIVDSLITAGGTISAKTETGTSGKIIVAGAPGKTEVRVTGTLDASGKKAGEKGGAVHVTGDKIALMGGAKIDASGHSGGGEILVGGDYKGGDYRGTLATPTSAADWGNTPGGYSAINGTPDAEFFAAFYRGLSAHGSVPTASRVYVDANARVDASATTSGNGGRAIFWSDHGTAYYGHTDVSAGAGAGNGGFIEISGRDWLDFNGTVDASAIAGVSGTLLLDPADITISNAANSNISGATPFQSTGAATSNLQVSTLVSALNGGANIIISSAAGTGGNGDVTFTDAVSWNSTRSLTVNASRHINVNNNIINAGSGGVTLNANVSAIGDIVVDGNITTAGDITLLANRDITLNAGRALTTGAGRAMSLRAANGVTTGVGNLNLLGNLSVGSGNFTLRSGSNGTRPSYTLSNANFTTQAATINTIDIQGFEDFTLDRSLASSSNTFITANRDLNINAGSTLTGAGLLLNAANSSTVGTGNLNILGNLAVGTGTLTLSSGSNVTRPSYTLNASNFTQTAATVGQVTIQGFEDLVIDRNITSSGSFILRAFRNLTLNSGRTLTTGAGASFDARSANGSTAGSGLLSLLGNISTGGGNLTLISGLNGAARTSYLANSTNLNFQSPTVGTVSIQGFDDFTLDRFLNSSSSVTISNNNRVILSDDITSAGGMTFTNNPVVVDQGVTTTLTSGGALTFSNSTLNGTAGGAAENVNLVAGTNTVVIGNAVGGTVPLGNLTITADNLSLNSTLRGDGTLTIQPSTAGRTVNIGTADTDGLTTNGLNLSNNETGRISDGWASIVFGRTAAGTLTNSRVSFTDAVSFITGVDFINSAAISSTATVFAQAVRDVILNSSITTSDTTANATTLVAGRNFINNAGVGALATGAGGRWLVYSTSPTGSTGEETLANNFNRYSCTFGGACPTIPTTGNGLLYTFTPTLTITPTGSYNYGDAASVPTTFNTTGFLNALDTSTSTFTGSGIFATSYVQGDHAGSMFTLTNNGSTLASDLGYAVSYAAGSGTVGQRAISITANNQTHTYGFGGLGTTGFGISSGSLFGTDMIDAVTLSTNATLSSSGQFNYSATPWSLSASAANFSSGLAGNYAITYVDAPTGLTINRRDLTLATITATDRGYNGLTNATLTASTFDNAVSGDLLSVSGLAGTFDSRNVGTRTATATAGTLAGVDANNYSFSLGSASDTADITAQALTVTANDQSIIYGAGNSFNGFTVGAGLQNGETVTGVDLATNATLSTSGNWNADTTPWNITASNATGGAGFLASNYDITYVDGTLNVARRALTLASITAADRGYNGLTNATLTASTFDNAVSGDLLSVSGLAGTFDSRNVGTRTATATAGTLAGVDANNYSFSLGSASDTADITAQALTVTANDQSIIYGAGNSFNGFSVGAGLQNGETLTGVDLATNATLSTSGNWNYSATPWNITASNAVGGAGFLASNYDITYVDGDLNVARRDLTLATITAANKVFDGNNTASISGFSFDDAVAGDQLSLAGLAGAFDSATVGLRTASVTAATLAGADAGNYDFTIGSATDSAEILAAAVSAPPPPPPTHSVLPPSVELVSQGAPVLQTPLVLSNLEVLNDAAYGDAIYTVAPSLYCDTDEDKVGACVVKK